MFVVGNEYKRSVDIHGQYGGQQQGGISTPKNHPLIFIFTSDSGEQHGYRDEFRADGIFHYTGEGQLGDMKMIAGNRAILEHKKHSKTIHVFESTRKSYVRYVGTAECLGYDTVIRPDREGNDRSAFVFHLDIDSFGESDSTQENNSTYLVPDVKTLKSKELLELREAVLSKPSRSDNRAVRSRHTYYRSEALKLYVIKRSKGICEGCSIQAPFSTRNGPYLECHHVHRVSDGGPDHPTNVVALCPNCHRRAHYSVDAAIFNEALKAKAMLVE